MQIPTTNSAPAPGFHPIGIVCGMLLLLHTIHTLRTLYRKKLDYLSSPHSHFYLAHASFDTLISSSKAGDSDNIILASRLLAIILCITITLGFKYMYDDYMRTKCFEFQAKERQYARRKQYTMEEVVQRVERMERDAGDGNGGAEWISVVENGEVVAQRLVARK
jgi:hypothetical protein